jgi:hypothetical protein
MFFGRRSCGSHSEYSLHVLFFVVTNSARNQHFKWQQSFPNQYQNFPCRFLATLECHIFGPVPPVGLGLFPRFCRACFFLCGVVLGAAPWMQTSSPPVGLFNFRRSPLLRRLQTGSCVRGAAQSLGVVAQTRRCRRSTVMLSIPRPCETG